MNKQITEYMYIFQMIQSLYSVEKHRKHLHNLKTLVCVAHKKYKIIDADLRNTPLKSFLKLVKSQKTKVNQFARKLRQVKKPNFQTGIIFICGLILFCLVKSLSKYSTKANLVFLNK